MVVLYKLNGNMLMLKKQFNRVQSAGASGSHYQHLPTNFKGDKL